MPALLQHSAGRDISVIEGVMGYYDGLAGTSSENSTADIARLTQSPTVLVVSAKGMSLTLAALLRGFLQFEQNTIRGVILNGISPRMTDYYAGIVEQNTGLSVFGAMPTDAACAVESRHLGLVTAGEIQNLKQKMQALARHARDGLQLDGAARPCPARAPELQEQLPPVPVCGTGLRIGVARDEAFCFDYADSLDVLTRMGAQLVPFSPLRDAQLPDNLDGLYLCGGYPELYAQQLGANRTMLAQLRAAIAGGMPTIAECGGFLLLHQDAHRRADGGHLRRHGADGQQTEAVRLYHADGKQRFAAVQTGRDPDCTRISLRTEHAAGRGFFRAKAAAHARLAVHPCV